MGFTLLEVLVTMAIFVAMGGVLLSFMTMTITKWRDGERRGRTYERAQEVLAQIALDLEAVQSRDPVEVGVPLARFFCTVGAEGQRLSFVRTYGAGPERSSQGPIGLVGVGYFRSGRNVMRTEPAPPGVPGAGDLTSVLNVARGTPAVLGTDCLHLGFRFWTQHTVNWDAPPPDQKKPAGAGPESIWDSTRGTGITAVDEKTGQPRLFCLARGIESLAYPADDVFPAIVEVTFVVEPDERRALKTELVEPMSESDPHAVVATTAGFEDPATVSPYLLIGSEWVRCKSKDRTRFTIAARGVRGTPRASHEIGTVVRAGTTFVMRAYVPAFRDDWSSMKDFLQNVRPR